MIRHSGLFNATWIMILLLSVLMWQCQKDDSDDPLDTIKPTVTSTVAANSAVDVAVSSTLTATFSEAMFAGSITTETFTLMQGTTSVSGVVTYADPVATFTPAASLAPSTVYTATITTGAKDLASNALEADYVWSFTTGIVPDNNKPTVVTTLPLNAAIAIETNTTVSATFSEVMDPLTVTASTFTLMNGATAVTGIVTYTGLVATFTPSANLAVSTEYTATITSGVKDLAGNSLAENEVWSFTTSTTAAPLGVVNLRAAGNYVILAKTGISNISTSAITGDLGLSPAATSYITGLSLTDATGYATSAQVTGQVFAADMADPTPINLTTAVENMITAYNDAAGRLSPDFLELGTGAIGGMTLNPGLYKWSSSVTLLSDVTISGGADDVFIFQIAQDLTMASAKNLILTGGVQAKNIFWQVAGTVTIGTSAQFEGIILSITEITFQTGASFKGRALAQTAVVLDGNTVILPE